MSEIIQFGTFEIFFRSDGSCRLTPPYPASWRRPRPQRAVNSSLDSSSAADTAAVDAITASPSFVDAIRQGYIIPAPLDFRIDMERLEDGTLKFAQRLPKDINPDQYKYWAPFPDGHSIKQVAGSPWQNAPQAIKLRPYWYIETPPGYSCLFISPQHLTGEKLPFFALPGMVETDVYKNLISFPMIPQCEFPTVIRAGTPLVQVIPIKRTDWKFEVICE